MADIHQLPDEQDVVRKASEWIARLNAEDVTPEDRAGLDAWKTAHPTHARIYEEMSSALGRFTAAGAFVRAVSFAQSMNHIASVAATDTGARDVFRRRLLTWVAAACLAAFLASLAWICTNRSGLRTTFVTAMGESSTVSLPDGSRMEMNSDSRARVEYSPAQRLIYLDRGEAFFNVAHDSRRPFLVVGGGSWVRAVGTAFNVDMRSAGMRVIVSEGSVKVGKVDPQLEYLHFDEPTLSGPPSISVLTAGQQADLREETTETRRLTPAQLAGSIAWRDGTLHFENQPLGEVVDVFRRYTSLELVIPDESLRALPIGGTFQASPQGVETLLTLLEQGVGLTLHRDANRVIIEDHRNKN